MELRSLTLEKRTFDDGPDSLGCAVGCAILMFLGVLFVIVLYVLWEMAMSRG
jgi:hypothetical protein